MTGGDQNNYLIVGTEGTKSNRDGIGTRVKLRCGDVTQVNEVRSGSSYLSQNDLRVHFGLGECTTVDRWTYSGRAAWSSALKICPPTGSW